MSGKVSLDDCNTPYEPQHKVVVQRSSSWVLHEAGGLISARDAHGISSIVVCVNSTVVAIWGVAKNMVSLGFDRGTVQYRPIAESVLRRRVDSQVLMTVHVSSVDLEI